MRQAIVAVLGFLALVSLTASAGAQTSYRSAPLGITFPAELAGFRLVRIASVKAQFDAGAAGLHPLDNSRQRIARIGVIGMQHPFGAIQSQDREILVRIGRRRAEHIFGECDRARASPAAAPAKLRRRR